MRRLCCLLLLLWSAGSAAAAAFSPLAPGPYAVGWRLIQHYDTARRFPAPSGQGEGARPVQTQMWYPAAADGQRLRYADYQQTQATEVNFSAAPSAIEQLMARKQQAASAAIGAERARMLREQAMLAVREAPARTGRYPLIVYAPGVGGAAHEVADMAEFLASHGYVVLASRSMGSRNALMDDGRPGIEAQAGDIVFLLNWASQQALVDMDKVGVMGWSWGGMANLFAAERDPRIKALVSLDGTREPEFTRQLAVDRLRLPWLYVQRHPETVSQLNRAGIETQFSLLNAASYADVYELVMYPMRHEDFSSAILRFQPASWFEEYTREEVEQAYAWTARYVLAFFNAHLKQDAAGKAFLLRRPVENGLAPHMARMHFRPRQAPPTN